MRGISPFVSDYCISIDLNCYFPSDLLHFLGKHALQFFTRQAQLKLALDGYGDATCLLAHHNRHAVTFLRDSQGGTMTQSQFLGNIKAMTHREDASCRHNPLMGYEHGTIMKGRILEEDVFYQLLIDNRSEEHTSELQ